MRIPDSYRLPVILALALHMLAGLALLVVWPVSDPVKFKPVPTHVKASLVQVKSKAKPVAPRKQVKKKPKPEKKKTVAKKPPPQKSDQQKKKEIALKKKKEKAARDKKEAERKAREKAAAEKKAKQQREKELKRQRELKQQELQREQELASLLESEEAFEQEQQQAATDHELAMGYADVIRQQVIPHWSRPPSARNGMVTVLQISLVPTGEVVDVNVIKSSGDAAFDDSTLRAVRRAGRFPELQQLEPRVFDRYFRKLQIEFKPEDLIR